MQTSNTRVVTFEMCGNDGLQARSTLAGESGTCDYTPLDDALANCTTYQQLAEASYQVLEKVTRGNLERVVKEDWRGQARRLPYWDAAQRSTSPSTMSVLAMMATMSAIQPPVHMVSRADRL